MTPNGSRIYVTNKGDNNFSVIDVTTKTVADVIAVGDSPIAFGLFIGPAASPGNCLPSATTICLNNGRFRIEMDWATSTRTGRAHVAPGGTGDSSNIWFRNPNNWEMLIKVLDGCGINNNFWVFFAATTNVEFTVTVTDTQTDQVKQYFNPLGNPANAVNDTRAFPTCP